MSFGEQLQAVRRSNGLTQEQFAEQLQVSRQSVSKWESGRAYPEIEKILQICRSYSVTPDSLFCEELSLPAPEMTAVPRTRRSRAQRRQTANAFFTNLCLGHRWLLWGIPAGTLLLALLLGLFLKGGSSDMYQIIWVAAMVIFGVLEAVTVGLTSIWFMGGALGGLITAMCGGAIWLQLTVFFVVSIACLLAARPLVVKYVNKTTTATNADRVIGLEARVTETINNELPTGAVYADGKTWTARSVQDRVIETGTMVRVIRMEGVRLFVEEIQEETENH